MEEETEAKYFLAKMKETEWKDWLSGFKALPEKVAKVVAKMKKDDDRKSLNEFFIPRNKGEMWKEESSPSGNYRIQITPYSTKKGCWSYTQGLIFKKGSDVPIFEVRRNYSSFPFSWIEDHKNGHHYLVCGEDYQGQTVLELDTGKRRDFLPTDATLGFGFCWSNHRFHSETSTLVVDGCYWACPYEFRFFDFSNPIESGWPEIEMTDNYADSCGMWPTFEPDGIVKTYQAGYHDWDENKSDEENERLEKEANNTEVASKTFRRESLKLLLVEEWVSEKEKEKRREHEEGQKRYEEWFTNYRANDPLFLALKNRLESDSIFKPEEYISTGQIYPGWHPDQKELSGKRICRRIHQDKISTIDLDVAVDSNIVKLDLYRNGKSCGSKFFMEGTVEGMENALSYAKNFIGGK